jgi:hypothetical protein
MLLLRIGPTKPKSIPTHIPTSITSDIPTTKSSDIPDTITYKADYFND